MVFPSALPSLHGRRYADVALAGLVVLIVGMMIVPLPTPLLDVLLASNIAIAVLMMLVAIYMRDGLAFTAFPTVLLVTTLYRLALNVSSTRLILLQADAGEVIASFGQFVVRGNYVVGAVVFAILTLIQFLVIAKGSERVAEVGARFTLDAMPGKQMSIDAELRAGALSQDDARKRRRLLERESQFYGAMDGAMKFVKGDAIAGIVITIVNILGGLAIGVAMRGLGVVESLKLYGLLTIGDGLVSQIPALLISTAAGLVVTRVASEEEHGSLGRDIGAQIFGDPRALRVASVFLGVLALVPGLPALPFLVLGGTFFVASGGLQLRAGRAHTTADGRSDARTGERRSDARPEAPPPVIPLLLEVGPTLAARVGGLAPGGAFVDRAVPALRDRLLRSTGLPIPPLYTRPGAALAPSGFTLALRELPAGAGELPADGVIALASEAQLAALGVSAPTRAQGSTAADPRTWIAEREADRARAAGIGVWDAAEVLARRVEEALRARGAELIGLEEVQALLDPLERAAPALVRNVIPKPVSLALLTEILRRLAEERVTVRPLREILETLAVHAPAERDPVTLTELVRAGLRGHLSHAHAPAGTLHALVFDQEIEEAVRDAIQRTATGSYLALAPDAARDIVGAATRAAEASGDRDRPVFLTRPDVRRFVRKLLENDLPEATVLSYQELAPEVRVEARGEVRV